MTDFAPCRRAVRTQSLAVSPPPMTAMSLSLASSRPESKSGTVSPSPFAVRGNEIIERRQDPFETDTRRLDLARFVGPGGDEHGVVLAAQLFKCRIAADFEIQLELDAAFGKPLHAALDDSFSSLKFGMP